MTVKDYSEYFKIELDCWCHGLKSVGGAVDPAVVYKVIKQFTPVMRGAIEKQYVFDVFDTTDKLLAASRTTVCRKEIAFYILSQLPPPNELTAGQREVLNHVIDGVELTYRGARQRLEKKWGRIAPELTPNESALHLPLKSEPL